MKLAKLLNGELSSVVEVKNGMSIDGTKTQAQLLAEHYKPLCEVAKPDGAVSCKYVEYATCIVQEWEDSEGNKIQ